MKRILLVEDCREHQDLVLRALGADAKVRTVGSIVEARRALDHDIPDLVLLDLLLPDGDGFSFCRELRDDPRTRRLALIFLSARGDPADKAMAFSLGADDYLEKPFHPLELRARVQARLRDRDLSPLYIGDLEIDPIAHRVFDTRSETRQELDLTPREFRLLELCASHPDRVFTRLHLLQAIWGDTVVTDRTVDTHVSNLRRKLGELGDCIETVRGAGYRVSARSIRKERPATSE